MTAEPLTKDEITPGERRELRSVVRTQYRVLREEINTRVSELQAEANGRLRQRYVEEDAAWSTLQRSIDKVIERAQKQIEGLIEKSEVKPSSRYTPKVRLDSLYKPENSARAKLEQEFRDAISARAKTAKLQLDRQEADALRVLAADALQSEKAKSFLASIPSVTQLLPSTQLLEVEARFDVTGGRP